MNVDPAPDEGSDPSWAALSSAIKSAAAASAKQGGPGVGEQVLSARFDRFLSRVFAAGENSEWLLKGGSSLLARIPRSRATTDIDLTAISGTLDDAVAALQQCVAQDLNDHLTFTLAASRATGLGDTQPG